MTRILLQTFSEGYLTKWLNISVPPAIFNYMVNQNEDNLNEVFHALSNSTRRDIVHMLALKERTVSELAKPFDMSLAAISKHIKVLERANLVDKIVNGRIHICRLNTQSLTQATDWLHFYEKFWSNRFDLLEDELLKAKKKEH
ncbi:ArsR/SmtB family transcription factor [Bacillus sp. FSL K6-3431]|uniref:ArsR/SmtB family transcription factor n=1 Tax=Bacillus sp. FSL K6-3431 TaxID=2921500 RepID=UPI0030FAC86B